MVFQICENPWFSRGYPDFFTKGIQKNNKIFLRLKHDIDTVEWKSAFKKKKSAKKSAGRFSKKTKIGKKKVGKKSAKPKL